MDGSPNQTDFARLLGVSRNTVVRYENDEPGANKPIVIMRWAEVTGYALSWIYGDSTGSDDKQAVTIRYLDKSVLRLVA
jgi:transcriptional regulator with XRE-family HTH domain